MKSDTVPYKIVVVVVYKTWDDAMTAADDLRVAGYDVVIADDVVDLASNAAFMEVYADVSPGVWRDFVERCATATVGSEIGIPESADVIWKDIQRIVAPFHAIAESCAPVEDDHVPFEDSRLSLRGWSWVPRPARAH